MPKEVEIDVPNRREGTNVADWVEKVVGSAIYADHQSIGNACKATHMEYVKLPMSPNEEYIGQGT